MDNINRPSSPSHYFEVSEERRSETTTVVSDSIVESIIQQFKDRSEFGIKKYGVTLDRTDLNVFDWIEHAKQELMDGILYLEKLKKTLQSQQDS